MSLFESQRPRLTSIAYHLLGSAADAEDAVQNAWLAWRRVPLERQETPEAYLTTVTVREALRLLRRARARREAYPGPWLPEPVSTVDIDGETASLALLVVLEALPPAERAVFVLREAFGYRLDEIALMLDRTPAAVRQLASRASRHVRDRHRRHVHDPATTRAATERFIAAAAGGDLAGLMEILAPEVTFHSDGGGRVRAALRPVHGADRVARFAVGTASELAPGVVIAFEPVNGELGVVLREGGVVFGVLGVELDAEGRIGQVFLVRNPEKLSRVP
ncbi:RNA polymerase sigma factor SigJ [Actinorhabdospora filicis]|uniref:RNA polymerase sigma factor SigJ n=1 Tax=Actinorhabdospora filicis TaxID=1785913 RepID=UPI0025543468|nr:RNA polymerase sigma factor SigJ [Actinorhabdospora filicis]